MRTDLIRLVRGPLAAGLLTLAVLGGLALALPQRVTDLREMTLDLGLSSNPPAPSGQVVVVAITSETLNRLGRWPWPRARLAGAVAQVAATHPAALGLDFVLSDDDPAGSRALADILAPAALSLLPDGDAALQSALALVPTVLGAALSDHPQPAPPPLTPLLLAGPPIATTPWTATALEAPTHQTAQGLGVVSLHGEASGLVRRAPLLVLAGDAAAPGLAVDILRLAQSASALQLGAGGLGIGQIHWPLGTSADLRIRPTDPARWALRTITLDQLAQPHDFAGKIVLMGLTAPEAATLRPTAVTPLAPSVQIQADALETLLSSRPLLRPERAVPIEIAATLTLSLLTLLAALTLPPVAAFATSLALPAAFATAVMVAWHQLGLALDPATPALIAATTGLVATAFGLITARRRAAALRRRFERHLSPAIVARIAAQPGLTRLPGEAREVTAMFTDLQGFSAIAETLPPVHLIALLDRYFSGLTEIVHSHGGMIEKFVGDAAHILFNAPFDLPDHPAAATRCAQQITRFGETFAAAPASHGLGRTRVGFETGMVIVGDVGSGDKLDYTAHGHAMNLAARLEQECKTLGVTLLAGPQVQQANPGQPWQALGALDVRGIGKVAVFTLPQVTP
jgi:adenylate cyclase